MAVMNLGMGTSGFGVERPDSTVVKSQQEVTNDYNRSRQDMLDKIALMYSNQSATNAQAGLQSAAASALAGGASVSGLDGNALFNNAIQAGGLGAGWGDAARSAYAAAAPGYINFSNDSTAPPVPDGSGSWSIYNAQQELERMKQSYEQNQADYTNNQAATQQAYNQNTGNGFTGGLLNASYANPFGSTVTGAPSPAPNAPGFSSGMMGNTNAAASTGLTPTVSTNPWDTPNGAAQPAGSGSWGGPFGAKNPWSF